MVRPKRDRLKGCVEVDETYVGGTEVGVHGRETEDKAASINNVYNYTDVRGRMM